MTPKRHARIPPLVAFRHAAEQLEHFFDEI